MGRDMDEEGLGSGGIRYRRSVVADGTATPDEARELLAEFVRQASAHPRNIHSELIEHLRDCIAAFLKGRKMLDPAPRHGRDRQAGVSTRTLDKAFGVVRVASGGPRTDDDTLAEVAMQVLVRRLDGESFQDAASNVSEDRRARKLPVSSDSQVREVWAKHQFDGFLMLRLSKVTGVEESPPWTETEIEKLTQIFKGKAWFAPPHVDAAARLHAILGEVDRPGADASDLKARVAAVIARFDGIGPPKNSRKKPA